VRVLLALAHSREHFARRVTFDVGVEEHAGRGM
jgi:hypothetical protein